LAAADGLDPAGELELARFELCAEMPYSLGDADALGLELGGDAVLVVADFGLGPLDLPLQLLHGDGGLGERRVPVLELGDELVGALLRLCCARAVALELVQDF